MNNPNDDDFDGLRQQSQVRGDDIRDQIDDMEEKNLDASAEALLAANADDNNNSSGRKKHRRVCGMEIKRDATCCSLVAIPMLYFTNVCAGVFTSAQVVFLLRDEEFF